MPRGEWRKNLALVVTSVAFAVLILELFVRLTYRAQWYIPVSAIQPSGIFSYRMKDNASLTVRVLDGASAETTMNARGFRGPLVSDIAGKPLRVISIGDSFTFAWGLDLSDHCVSRFVADYARLHPDRDIGHAFAASPGWEPKDYYFAYMTEVRPFLAQSPGAEVKPPPATVVVLGFFAGNDILSPETPRILDPKDAPAQTTLPAPLPQPWLRFPDWMRTRVSGSLLATRIGIAAGYKLPAFARFDKDLAAQRPAWETTFFYVKALADAVKRDGGRFVILSYPSVVQVNAHRSLDETGYDHTAPDRMLEAFCKENGLDLITLLEPLKEKNEKHDLYWPMDRHMTARGHEIAAGVVEKHLAPIVDQVWDERARHDM
jgi:hypothetical protein